MMDSFAHEYLDKPECKRCTKALQELENIDDEADQLDIGFVKIHDESLADEYNLGSLPALVYYRHQIPILYEGRIIVSICLKEKKKKKNKTQKIVRCLMQISI